MASVDAPRIRRSFARLDKVLDVPNLIDIQKKSFAWLVDPEGGGLRETIDDISPIEDYTGNLAVQFGEFHFDPPVASLEECREKDLTYARPLTVTVGFINRETGEIREQSVFMGDFPWMTERGTFVINGTERVVVTQLVRSPGAYLMEPKDIEKQVFVGNLMPARGSWLELEIDKKGRVYVRIDRKRKLPVTVLLRAMGYASDEEILKLFDDSVYIRNTIEADTDITKSEEGALIELFKKQRPGEPPSVESARSLLHQLFFDPKRYDLTRVGRYKLNSRLGLDIDLDTRVLTHDDIIALVNELVTLPRALGMSEEDGAYTDYAAEALARPREGIADRLDEYEHFGNRRLRTVGELIQEAFRIGLYRMERVVRERLTTEDADTITPQTIINIRPVVAALKEFFGSSQLSQFMDQTNSLSGLTHRRRLSALGAGGLTRERAPIEVRDVHPTHYGRMCPIETPEGPNIGLIGSLSSYAEISEHGFVTTPYRVIDNGKVTDDIIHLDASQEQERLIAQSTTPVDKNGKLQGDTVLCRTLAGQYVNVAPEDVELMDVSPEQIWSVATAMIPFLEHDDANRALMGSNMQRQAVPLLKTDAPLIGTGMERRAALDTGDVLLAERDGTVEYVDAERIVIATAEGRDEYDLQKFMRSNQGTLIHQKPLIRTGQEIKVGHVLADGASSDKGEMALGKNLLVAFMSWEGYNFEDAIILSERLVKDDELTSIHIEEYEIDARTTKLGDEEITRDIPNRSEESLRNLDDRGIVRIGAEVQSGDLLVGKVTPKGETELTAEEKLIRAIFKEKAREVRDTSLKVPHGEGGVVIDVKTFSRAAGDDLSPGVNDLVRVFVAKKRKIAEGDKLAGRHGNKGVISKIVPEADMPFLEDGTPVDVILNPLGVPSRMNIGQILETHLGWAAANGWYDDGTDAYKGSKNDNGRVYVSTPVFDGATVEDVDHALVQWQKEHQGAIRMDIDTKRRSGEQASGKVTLLNGRSGEPFEKQVTVGYMYILKLLHLVDDKIHARSTGPYSLVTQQPLGGKAQFGGQRFGEMEVWALEAYGAAYTLQEMLTIKSDDTVGRVKAYEAIVKGENIAEPSIPESFKVLLKEMQSLALDVNVVSEEGTRAEMGDEDDDLLRAAEELGIDLSGVRSTDGGADTPADEAEEQEVEEGDEGMTDDVEATDAEYIEEDAPIGDILAADEE
ncbi:MAG TPA: DNA-directed RNA polymerase subunit beta [Thermoleophilaceae bacterium]|nr:DNA-directed RNA polymerase subunit beta [Thermoleophilaceae bacterium]